MFSDQFSVLLDHCNSLPGDLCVLGDFNIHFDLPHNPTTTKLLDLLRMLSLHQTVKQSTHRQGHIIVWVIERPDDGDWVIERSDDGVLKSTVVSSTLESDHKCVITRFEVNISPPPPVFRHVRNLRAIDCTVFRHDLHSELSRLEHPSTEQSNAALQSVLDKHTPVSKRKVSVESTLPGSVW